MLLIIHIIFGLCAVGLSVYALHSSPQQTKIAQLFVSIVSTFAATLTTGIFMVFAGASILRICVTALVFSSISLYAILRLYRTNKELRLEL